ncbi:MAG: hypothetical protein CR994_06345 [Maribacter sp.]|nr:MAG: hypothetical protein CR994_06345 [Maribacter sp.]
MRLPLFLCSFLVLASFYAQEEMYQALSLDLFLTKDANAVVRLDAMKIEVVSDHSMVYEVKQVVTCLE